ncbi:MAG: hypothetical protein UT84_C0020G0002 [Candidatus Curtissbacteria bacterium GW2011_GWA1_40_16]|uniref:DUF305 domain-containing protein n=1 Tax=Candidatus Curtissbacteria bacterium GW2011_GWA1_40_16 TaxID=1618405 RepID=A0A0G0RBJ9_9BACT|nr:MAG: hypothetical protein UT84_C0020G0002 [Candidatus Curtissbacteria bacterium GW2011_GWA1_40_16]
MKNPQRDSLLFGILGVLIGGAIVWFLATNAVNYNVTGMMQMMGMRSNNISGITSNIDKHFIEQMIPHHEGAIEMAQLAQERSKRPEILTLAKAIIQSQSQEIIQMRTWYKNWYQVEVPVDANVGMGMGRGMMQGGMMGGKTADIGSLNNAVNFDEAFLQEMIPHHQMAVVMAQMFISGTNRPEMKQLGQNIIKAQETEIDQMRSWLEEWSL